MKTIFQTVLKVIGLPTLISWIWEAAKDELTKLAKTTETELDDRAIDFVDKILKVVISTLQNPQTIATPKSPEIIKK